MMFASRLLRWGGMAVCVALAAGQARAEWTTQVLNLRPGWNAVFFEVQPDENACVDVFEGIPIRSVWTWNPRFPRAQYVQDPADLLPEFPEWLSYFPADGPQAFLSDLFAVFAGRSYLIELKGDAGVPLVITGMRRNRDVKWMKNSFNLMGFHVDPAALPSVQKFFAPSEAHAGQPVYRLTSEGKWREVAKDATARIVPGEAYWVFCEGESTYSGPLEVKLDWGEELDYGRTGAERSIILRNRTDSTRTVRLKLRSPERPTVREGDSEGRPLAGDVALVYYNLQPEDVNQKILSWAPVEDGTAFIVDANSDLEVRLAVKRSDMPASESAEAVYESVLEVSDGLGSLYRVPVAAEKSLDSRGLWLGTATVKLVSEAANPEDSVTPTRTASEFDFRVIVHRGADGVARFLQKVTVLEMQAKYGPNPDDSSGPEIVVEAARMLLLTRDDLVRRFTPDALLDGQLIARRISAPVFGFDAPILMTEGQWTDQDGGRGQRLTCEVVMDYEDPRNPFLHRFHPDHDNLDDRYEITLSEGKESFTFSRSVTFDFEDEDPDGVTFPQWGGNIQGGTYRETIEGLHKNTVYIEGTFRLHLVSSVEVLDDGV